MLSLAMVALELTQFSCPFRSDVAIWPDGGFVATWESYGQDGFGGGIFGQVFSVDRGLGLLCGDANSDLVLTLRDALRILRGSVGLSECNPCVCDTNFSGTVTVTDAALVLGTVVGLDKLLSCATCEHSE